jgi:hypothetical protein
MRLAPSGPDLENEKFDFDATPDSMLMRPHRLRRRL